MKHQTWYKHRRAVRVKTRAGLLGVVIVYLLVVTVALELRFWGSNPRETSEERVVFVEGDAREGAREGVREGVREGGLRKRRAVDDSQIDTGGGSILTADDDDNDDDNCTPRSIDNFPGNFFTLDQTQDGGVVIHILIALYLFGALAIVCDDYFVPCLERICEDLKIQEDVAGATFMAAGSSAPELCTSIVGVFIAKSDVGVGTIVGSAVFNILFIIGLCGLGAGMVVHLTWYPLIRDTLFYLLSVLALVLVIEDSEVHWYEAMSMLLLYVVYILLMYFNRRLEDLAIDALQSLKTRCCGQKYVINPDPGETDSLLDNSEAVTSTSIVKSVKPLGAEEAETGFSSGVSNEEKGEGKEDGYESPWEIPDSYLVRVYWVAMLPVRAACYVTVPDCRRGGVWRKLYPLTFLTSVVWIAAFTYVMVWMITITGDALNIPDTVMGLTLLAAGTSLPDCLASVLVARDGFGDMAVSNSIGSNVFDILLCLGLPWLIETVAVNHGDTLEISSSGLLYSSIILLATVAFLLISIAVNRWRLTKSYGVLCLVVYVIVITLSSLFELNVFDDLNPPACPR